MTNDEIDEMTGRPILRMAGLSEEDSDLLRQERERQERDGGEFTVRGYAWDD